MSTEKDRALSLLGVISPKRAQVTVPVSPDGRVDFRNTALVFTDGSSTGKSDGPGGWAWVERTREGFIGRTGYGGESSATSSSMELLAVLKAMEFFSGKVEKLIVYSDSKYVVEGLNSWVLGWERYGWKTASGELVKHRQFWKGIRYLESTFERVTYAWVKGHNGQIFNEEADRLAVFGKKSQILGGVELK